MIIFCAQDKLIFCKLKITISVLWNDFNLIYITFCCICKGVAMHSLHFLSAKPTPTLNPPTKDMAESTMKHLLVAFYSKCASIWLISLTLGACARVTVVCVCVSYHTSCFIPRLYVENTVPLSFLWRSQDIHCVDFVQRFWRHFLIAFLLSFF